jgi:hypothetical protein
MSLRLRHAATIILVMGLTPRCTLGGAPPARDPIKPRRVLFNCDGCSVRIDNNDKHDLNVWIDQLFAGLDANHVGALLWCDGSGGNTALYDSKVLELDGLRAGKPDPWVSKWIKEGNDPPAVVIREARKRGLDVFYSFRINDIHDAFTPSEFSTFKAQHPAWQIGQGHPYGYHTALNFAVAEVRDLKRRTIEEIFARYDFDGLEIDFLRGPPFFIPGKEVENAPILTDFLRGIRRLLDERARQRRRRIELMARVDETLEACRLDGFEVGKWVKDGLVDALIMGSGTIEVDVAAFRRLVAGMPVRIYPCLYGWPSKYNPIPAALARGIALTFWRDRPDGIYTFNWFPHQAAMRYQVDLLRDLGDPARLGRGEVMYAAERGQPAKEYPHNWMRSKLPTKLKAGQVVEIPIEVGRQPAAGARVELAVATNAATPLAITFDGRPVEGDRKAEGGRVTVSVDAASLSAGRHLVGLMLRQGEGDLTAVEIHVLP